MLAHWKAWAKKHGLGFECEELDELHVHNGLVYPFRLTIKGFRGLPADEENRLLDQLDQKFVWNNSNEGYEKETNKEVVAHVIPKRGDWSRKRSKKRRFAVR